jgi:hypothetical protein
MHIVYWREGTYNKWVTRVYGGGTDGLYLWCCPEMSECVWLVPGIEEV